MNRPDRPEDREDRVERDSNAEAVLQSCQRRIGYTFRNSSLLHSALTHASCAEHRLASNERLEFLGDAILGMVVCEHLFHAFPSQMEGELTRIKSVVVSRKICAEVSRDLGLHEHLLIGKGMLSHQTLPQSLLADVLESLVASIYLDGGWEPVREFINRNILPRIGPLAAGSSDGNYKSMLQQWAQRELGQTPTYLVLAEEGPDHVKSFRISARIGDLQFEPAWGNTKKQAAQLAAKNALLALRGR